MVMLLGWLLVVLLAWLRYVGAARRRDPHRGRGGSENMTFEVAWSAAPDVVRALVQMPGAGSARLSDGRAPRRGRGRPPRSPAPRDWCAAGDGARSGRCPRAPAASGALPAQVLNGSCVPISVLGVRLPEGLAGRVEVDGATVPLPLTVPGNGFGRALLSGEELPGRALAVRVTVSDCTVLGRGPRDEQVADLLVGDDAGRGDRALPLADLTDVVGALLLRVCRR